MNPITDTNKFEINLVGRKKKKEHHSFINRNCFNNLSKDLRRKWKFFDSISLYINPLQVENMAY